MCVVTGVPRAQHAHRLLACHQDADTHDPSTTCMRCQRRTGFSPPRYAAKSASPQGTAVPASARCMGRYGPQAAHLPASVRAARCGAAAAASLLTNSTALCRLSTTTREGLLRRCMLHLPASATMPAARSASPAPTATHARRYPAPPMQRQLDVHVPCVVLRMLVRKTRQRQQAGSALADASSCEALRGMACVAAAPCDRRGESQPIMHLLTLTLHHLG